MRRRGRESLDSLDDEIRDHILRETDENIARGMAPGDAYAVAQRTKEIGVRIALGAARGQVVATVLRQGMAVTLAGIALGLAGALASTQVMTALLYEVTPTDFATFAAAVMTVGVTAFTACCGPAVRASLIDPLVALRCD
jgi:putative ABC transport system permease protein